MRSPTTQPTSGSRRPRWFRPCGPKARRCREAGGRGARSRAGRARWPGARARARPRRSRDSTSRRRRSSPTRSRIPRRAGRRRRAPSASAAAGRKAAPVPRSRTRARSAAAPLPSRSRSRRPAGARTPRSSGRRPSEQRPQVAAKVGVAEQNRAGRRRPLGQRQRLSLAAVRQPEHPGARCGRNLGSPVSGAVVGDDHLRVRELPLSARRQSSRSAPPRRVPRRGS